MRALPPGELPGVGTVCRQEDLLALHRPLPSALVELAPRPRSWRDTLAGTVPPWQMGVVAELQEEQPARRLSAC